MRVPAVRVSAEELRRRLGDGLHAKLGFTELRAFVVEFAAAGGRRDVASAVIDQLRAELGEHDALLDLLDVASGFCDPALRIWSDDSYRRHHAGERRPP